MMHRLQKNSAYTRRLPEGCKRCGMGQKLVLFVTGICNNKCFYCPLSAEKRGRDVVFANEKKVAKTEDIIQEARLIDATGTGITGGDPLAKIDRTIKYINLLRENFGEKHHIHLYTATASRKMAKALAESGLDELRLHPPPSLWGKMRNSGFDSSIAAAIGGGMKVGVEIPAIPKMDKPILSLISYLDSIGADFVNLNELEFSETNCTALLSRGYRVKDDVSSGVAGSEKMARGIIKKADSDIPLHYCSASYKDGVQLRNRIMRRAKNIAKPSDIISDEGLLVKGILEGSNLNAVRTELVLKFKIQKTLIHIDKEKKRLEIAPWILEKIALRIPHPCYIVEEYPTADRLEVERMRIN